VASETSWERFSRRTLLGGAIRTRRTYVFGLGLVALLLLSSLAAASEGGPRRAASNPDVPSTPTPVRATPVEAAERALPISPEVRTGVGEFAWTNVTYGPAPSPRQGYGIAYDANDGYVVLFGGYPVGGGPRTFLNDTWTFRGGLWTNITSTAGIAPAAREYPQMLYDASDGSILLLGGETFEGTATDVWSFSTGHWTELNATEPPALEGRCGYQATYDSTEGVALILVPTCFSNTTNPVYMYAYHAGVWSNLSVNHTTNQSLPATMLGTSSLLVDDPTLHGVVLFGGFNSSTRDGLNETWLYSGGNWTDLAAGLTGGGPARFEPGGDFDTAYPGVLVFGGFVCECELDSTNVTWILSNTTWTEFAPGPAPAQAEGSSYWGGAAVWDGADNATVWFGGNDNATWEWGGPPAPFGLTLDASPNPADSNVSIAFSSTHVGGTGPDSYAWSFGDGSTSANAAPRHAYASAGTYPVGLTIRDGAGRTTTASLSVSVGSGPAAIITARPDPVDVGISTNFSVQITGGFGAVEENWSWGDGTSGVNDSFPAHVYSAVGNYTVNLNATDAGGARFAASTVVRVDPALVPPMIVANPSAPALGQLVQFTASEPAGTAPYTFSWAFGDGGTGGNLSTISHIFTTNGPFVTTATVRDAAGAVTSGSLNLSIALNVTVVGNWTAGAAPLDVGFDSMVVGGVPGYQYAWNFGDGGTSSAASPSHEFTTPGSYTASVQVTDREGRDAGAEWAVFVAASTGGPISVALTADPSQIAPGASATVAASVSGGVGGFTLVWSDASANCASAGPVSVRCTPPGPNGQFPVTLEVSDRAGHVASATTDLAVAGIPGSVAGPEPPTSPWLVIGAVAAVVVVVLLAVLAVARRSRPTGGPSGEGSAFEAYRTSPGASSMPRPGPDERPPGASRPDAPPNAADGNDPLSDLE
jgi:PKD repeat protein